MATMKQARRGTVWIGKLEHGADLLDEITAVCREAGIQLGRVQAIGAVQRARLACYDQQGKAYEFFDLGEPLEILNLTGNISTKDGQPMVHAHVVLSKGQGETFGGHLAAGTVVFAGECIVEELLGLEYVRRYDETTGLPLWDI